MPSSVIRRIGPIVLVLIALLCSAVRLSAQTGTVQGKVADSTGAVVPGVTVTVDQTSVKATTNADGRYILRGVPAGARTVRARVIRFAPATVKVTVKADDAVELNITLKHTITVLAPVDVVVGSHGVHTAADELAVPVDIYGSVKIAEQGSTETGEILAALSPSINFPTQSVTDANDIVRPFTLRGLSPDHTLVLINGWRQHQTALLNTFPYGSAAGSSGVDLNAIPASAIGQVEVLRDGAASQYGSDAIAGVVNIKLKDGDFDPFLQATGGQYNTGNGYKVDGQAVDLNGGFSVPVGHGSLGLFGEYGHHDPTNRAWADPSLADQNGVTDIVDPNTGRVTKKLNSIPQPNYHWGDGLEDDGMLFGNLRLPVGSGGNSEVYAFGGYSKRVGTGNGYYRYSGDNTNWTQIYPNGFLPQFHPLVQDYSVTGGVRTEIGGWATDIGLSYGANSFEYHLENTLNPSLGPSLSTPYSAGAQGLPNQLSFNAGELKRGEFEAGATLTKAVAMGLRAPVNVALGALFRDESYQVIAGEKASWINADTIGQAGDPATGGSSVFPGFAPSDVSSNSRTNIGIFADLESNVSEAVLLNVAGRYENYSDFGSALTGKIAARYQPTSEVVLRGTLSTEFRAPGLPQSYWSHTTTNFIGGQLVQVGNYPVNNPVSQLFGAQPLKDETSVNLSAGIAYTPRPDFTMTLDAFWIQITNRILLGATFDGSSDTVVARILTNAGYTTIGAVQFFSNGIDTKTTGVDVTGNWVVPAGKGSWDFNLALNWTQNLITRVRGLPPVLQGTATTYTSALDLVTTLAITKERPDWRGILTATYTQSHFHGLARFSYYGQFSSAEPSFTDSATYAPRTLTDAEVGYQFANVDLSVGSRNLFNIYPGRMWNSVNNNGGVFPWAAASPFGYNGRYVYVRANMVLIR